MIKKIFEIYIYCIIGIALFALVNLLYFTSYVFFPYGTFQNENKKPRDFYASGFYSSSSNAYTIINISPHPYSPIEDIH